MSTRPLAQPSFIPDDPGPWSDVLEVLQRRGVRPGHRRSEPPNGLMLTPPPRTILPIVGLDSGVPLAGVAPSRIIAAARQPALRISIGADATSLSGDSRMVRRTWSLPGLALLSEERPSEDPAASIPPATPLDALVDGDLPADAAVAPGGVFAAVSIVEGRSIGIAIVRIADRGLMRYIRGCRAAAWTPDGAMLVVSGDWGLLTISREV